MSQAKDPLSAAWPGHVELEYAVTGTPTEATVRWVEQWSGRKPRTMSFAGAEVEVFELGFAAARQRFGDVLRAAGAGGVTFKIGNERNPLADAVVLLAPSELDRLVNAASARRKRSGAEVLAGMPFAAFQRPALRLSDEDDHDTALRVPAAARQFPA